MTAAVRLRMLLALDRPTHPRLRSGRVRADGCTTTVRTRRRSKRSAMRANAPRSCWSASQRTSGSARARTPTVGPYGVMKWLEIYGKHAHSHARQIVEASAWRESPWHEHVARPSRAERPTKRRKASSSVPHPATRSAIVARLDRTSQLVGPVEDVDRHLVVLVLVGRFAPGELCGILSVELLDQLD